jgi:Fic family protein
MKRYIHEREDWPSFSWDGDRLAARLAAVRHQQGRLLGRMEALGLRTQQETLLKTLTEDVLKSSEIEGEFLDRNQIRSSVARRLGLNVGGLCNSDRNIEGIVEMMLDASTNFHEPLTAERLFAWHASLFPAGRSGMRRIAVGRWRDDSSGPMQVVSGPIGRERVHYQAPSAARIDAEMAAFLAWFHGPNDTDWVMKAALAHLWLVTIHPFDDGNGRIARAVADLALARSEQSSQRFYSMSAKIREERDAYYSVLEQTQQATMDVTPWLEWFFDCMARAISDAQQTLSAILEKTRFWERASQFRLNDRHRLVLNRLMEGFEGKLTTGKWAKLAKCSHDTALRDIEALAGWGLLARSAEGGRSTSYALI